MHPQKCAGGSVSLLIKKHFSDDLTDIYFDNGRRNNHPDFLEVLERANKPIDSYFKFAVIRNTWDRVVSMYFHAKKHLNYHKPFEDFVLRDGISGKRFFKPFHMKPKLTFNDEYIIDFTIRHENFEKDVDYVMNRLGIQDYSLTHCTHHTGRDVADYRTFYNQQTTDFVYNIFKWEINKFNYKFQ